MKPVFCTQGHENPTGSRFCLQCGEKLNPANTGILSQGMILGERYRVQREIGRGGFGRTYLAEDINRFNEHCVLKEFAPQVAGTYALQKGQELFEREAGILYKLQHPQIPRFREMFRANYNNEGHLFLVQDYVEGQNYRTLLQNRRVQNRLFTEPEITQFFIQILPVLAYIHSQGVIHRDISPDNIILRNSDLLPVLIDFGGVKEIAANLQSEFVGTQPATRLGKVGYAPDEQMQMGKVYPHSDLYSLAVTGLVLLTGIEPQNLRDPQTLLWNWHKHTTLSPTFSAVLDKMLAYRPGERYQNAGEVLNALQNFSTPTPQPQNLTQNLTQPIAPQQKPVANISPQPKTNSNGNLLVMGGIIVAMTSIGLWAGNYWVDSQRQPNNTDNITPDNTDISSQFSPQEQQRKIALQQQRKLLLIDYKFYVQLVNQIYFDQYPEQKGTTLTDKPQDETWRERWDNIAQETLKKLQTISEPARRRMGSYKRSDPDRRKIEINKKFLGSRSLNDLTDVKFFSLFPEQRNNQNFINTPIGQVWQAIAEEQTQNILNGTAIEEIKFQAGTTSTALNDTLQPATGKAYIAKLNKNQFMQLNLEPQPEIQLSIYPPSGKTPPLLQDSPQLNWSGKLPENGYYEIIIVSQATQPVSYQLTLSVTNSAP
ncbi:serine/threonine protein kinase [Ancylothrix sp. C2]|uniref:serine/threonine-protein kinase n=1 Tax=Ancylothrix sp. D3o TaxID=2953691 RepID=UPI0021BB6BED|nr:serine/threonine-protein kinase [Ancylothrix sp. D3o]MCT7950973.1 serine/threonine protein kinase [Ancylothrix sp. D3o]